MEVEWILTSAPLQWTLPSKDIWQIKILWILIMVTVTVLINKSSLKSLAAPFRMQMMQLRITWKHFVTWKKAFRRIHLRKVDLLLVLIIRTKLLLKNWKLTGMNWPFMNLSRKKRKLKKMMKMMMKKNLKKRKKDWSYVQTIVGTESLKKLVGGTTSGSTMMKILTGIFTGLT
jgi:hypothetical protein